VSAEVSELFVSNLFVRNEIKGVRKLNFLNKNNVWKFFASNVVMIFNVRNKVFECIVHAAVTIFPMQLVETIKTYSCSLFLWKIFWKPVRITCIQFDNISFSCSATALLKNANYILVRLISWKVCSSEIKVASF